MTLHAPRAAELAALQATTSSFARGAGPEPSRWSAISIANRSSSDLAALSVGEARGVAEVDVVLPGQGHEQLVEHGEAADAGVKNGDRQFGVGRGAGHACMVSEDTARPPGWAGAGGPAANMGLAVRALIVTNMYPSPAHPALGSFVADQVAALRRLEEPGLELEVFAFAPGGPAAYAGAARRLRARYRELGPV